MEEKIKENIDNILYQIKSAKTKGKKSIKVKVYQSEGDNILYNMIGMTSENDEGVKHLKENGYFVNFETNDKQVSMKYNMKGELANTTYKDLCTTSIIVGW